jgi:hypothetical protein
MHSRILDSQLRMKRLSHECSGSSPKYMHMSGRGNVDLKATARGEGADAILKTLNGKFGLNGADGTVEGIDLGYALAQADALIGKHELSYAPNTKRTKFDSLKMKLARIARMVNCALLKREAPGLDCLSYPVIWASAFTRMCLRNAGSSGWRIKRRSSTRTGSP